MIEIKDKVKNIKSSKIYRRDSEHYGETYWIIEGEKYKINVFEDLLEDKEFIFKIKSGEIVDKEFIFDCGKKINSHFLIKAKEIIEVKKKTITTLWKERAHDAFILFFELSGEGSLIDKWFYISKSLSKKGKMAVVRKEREEKDGKVFVLAEVVELKLGNKGKVEKIVVQYPDTAKTKETNPKDYVLFLNRPNGEPDLLNIMPIIERIWNNQNEESENLRSYPRLTPQAEKKKRESGYVIITTPKENLIGELKNWEKRKEEWGKARDIIRKERDEVWRLYHEEVSKDRQSFLDEKVKAREKSLEEAMKKWGGHYKIQPRKFSK